MRNMEHVEKFNWLGIKLRTQSTESECNTNEQQNPIVSFSKKKAAIETFPQYVS